MDASSWKRPAVLCAVALVIAPIGDWAHVESGTTEYLWSLSPMLGNSPWWFFGLIAAAVLGALPVRRGLARRLGDVRFTWQQGGAAIAGCMTIYAATSLARGANLAIATIALYAASLLVFFVVDGTGVGFLVGVWMSLTAVLTEMTFVAFDAFRYADDVDVLFGVAPWLPALHFLFGVAVAVLDRVELA